MNSPLLGRLITLLTIVLCCGGCGLVGDKDLIPLARIGEETITRGDLRLMLRMLPPEEKPIIGTKGDVRKVLNDFVDDKLKALEAQRLLEEGAIEMNYEAAEQMYFAENPDTMDVRNVEDPRNLPVAISQAELENMKESIARGIEMKAQEILENNAISHLVYRAFETGRYEISEAEWEREYRIQKNNLFHTPRVTVKAIALPAINDQVSRYAAEFRERIDRGEDLDALLDEYEALERGQVLNQEMAYDARQEHLRTFWEAVSETKRGDIFGPVSIAPQVIVVQGPNGEPQQVNTPATFLIGRVEEYVEPVQKTLEEAKPDLAAAVLYVRVIDELRQRYDVEIFEENLYTPEVSMGGGAGPVKPQQQMQQ